MYYRYKVNKKERKGLRRLLVVLMVCLVSYAVYTYRQYLFFWKYNSNKLQSAIEEIEKTNDQTQRKHMIEDLVRALKIYRTEHPVEPVSFLMSGRVHYLRAELYQKGSFTELFVRDMHQKTQPGPSKEFLSAIRYFKKGQALLRDEPLSADDALLLAKSCFYTGYSTQTDIYALLARDDLIPAIRDVQDLRFFAVISILNGREDEALELLNSKGKVDDSARGVMFLAAAECLAQKYTSAIMHYKKVLTASKDRFILNQVHVSLGKIYFNQSLYKESLLHFTNAINLDNEDYSSKIWIGKNYYAMGYKDKARAIWSDVLTIKSNNMEVKELLGIM